MVVAIIFTLVRVWVGLQTPVFCNMNNILDEGLFMREAWSILEGSWLGDTAEYVMLKNPGFPLFLAFTSASGLSYQFWIMGVGIFAAALSALALAPIVRSPWLRLGIYLWVLFCPLLFCLRYALYVYRNAYISELTLIVVASYFGLWLRRDQFAVRWLIPSTVALGLFWITNENIVWLVPFVAVASVVIAVLSWRRARVKTLWLFAPPVACALAWLCVSLANLSAYGLFMNNVRFEGNEGRVAADLLTIGGLDELEPYELRDVWVTSEELDAAIEQSSTLASAADEVRASYEMWAGAGDGVVPGDIYSWALVHALEMAKPDSSPAEREEFWGQVHDELTAAFASGALEREEGLRLSATTPAIPEWAIGVWIGHGVDDMLSLFDGSLLGEGAFIGTAGFEEMIGFAGTPDEQEIAQLVVNGPMVHASEEEGLAPISRAGRLALKVDYTMMLFWRFMLPIASIVGLVALVYLVVCAVRGSRRARVVLLPVAGIFLTVFALSLAVSWFSEWIGAVGLVNYLAPGFLLASVLLAWLYAIALAEILEPRGE